MIMEDMHELMSVGNPIFKKAILYADKKAIVKVIALPLLGHIHIKTVWYINKPPQMAIASSNTKYQIPKSNLRDHGCF